MLLYTNVGIVLKNYFPNKHKIILLDKELGKTECFLSKSDVAIKLSSGALFKYSKVNSNSNFIGNLDIIESPLDQAKANILFFHHVLEICYYFMSMESPEPEIFNLLIQLYYNFDKYLDAKFQKLFICRVFALLGLYPKDYATKSAKFLHFLSIPVDMITQAEIDLVIERLLNNWIAECFNLHPYAHLFKTKNYLSNLG